MLDIEETIAGTRLTDAERRELRRLLGSPAKLQRKASDLLSRFLLAEVVNGALTSASLDDLLQRLIELATQTLEAERGTIFLVDRDRDELYSRVKQGNEIDEIRFPSGSGIAGAVLASGRSAIVADAYGDPRFNPAIDQATGYRTRSLIAVPLRETDGAAIGVIEILNKRDKGFAAADLLLLEAIARQASAALDQTRSIEHERRERKRDLRLLEFTEAIAAEIELDGVLGRIVDAAANLLEGDRATLFVHDPAAGELVSRVTAGGRVEEIRVREDQGIAGATLTTGETSNIRDAYADGRFNPAIDALTGYVTKSLVSVPVPGSKSRPIGVIQVLNSRHGSFGAADERRLRSFACQAGIALQNAQLFADVLALKSYTESLLRSLPDGVIKLDPRFSVVSANDAARKLLRIAADETPVGSAAELWGRRNPWLLESLDYVARTGGTDYRPDVEFAPDVGDAVSVNASVAALRDAVGGLAGFTLILQDIERQKKVQATFSRYVAKEFVDEVLSGDATRRTVSATVLFSDIRRFTALAEALAPQRTVEMLNEYFAEMADVVHSHGGVLDKYIGDAVMAVFGIAGESRADADEAAAAAIDMIRRLRRLNELRRRRGAQPLEIGIGLATGEIVVGPVGAPTRMNYTVIGDSVNLASRLESANKLYRTSVLAAGPTVNRMKNRMRLRRIDLIRVTGKSEPTEIFELADHRDAESRTKFDAIRRPFEDGLRRYRARQWSRALECFAAALETMPNDGPSWVYTDRCLYYRDHPPPDHWDGVWAMQTK